MAVRYVTYQQGVRLTREAAEWYLSWLDEGGIGMHWEAEQTKTVRGGTR